MGKTGISSVAWGKKYIVLVLFWAFIAGCTEFWSGANQRRFTEACVEESLSWAGSEERASDYCECVLGKMMQRYPNDEDALLHLASLAKDTALINCKGQLMLR